jgi:hypothetical protein
MVTRPLLYSFLLFHAIGRVASARDVIAISGVVTTPAEVLCPLKLAQPRPRLPVDIVFDGPPMSAKVEASAMKEVTLIWAAYGVDINAPKASDGGRDSAIRLAVKLADGRDRQLATGALGSIRFVDDVPEPTIVMYPDAIAALVSSARFVSDDFYAQAAFRDLILGRVLGRALAHEIGHFLLRSRHHSAAGLMRALQPAPDLVAPGRHGFGLTADEATRLVSVTSLSLQSPVAAFSWDE